MGGGGRGGQLQPVRQALAATLVTVGQLAQDCGKDRAQNAEAPAPAVQPRHLPNAARAAEQFIAAESREGHLDALSSRQARHAPDVEPSIKG